MAAAVSCAAALGLPVEDAVVLSDSNRLVVRLTPCDVVARVAIAPPEYAERLAGEVEVVRRLEASGSPVAGLLPRVEPRLFTHDGFTITMWTHFEHAPPRELSAAEYSEALQRLHAGLQQIGGPAPHYTDRVGATQRDVADRAVTPDLPDGDRTFLAGMLHDLQVAVSAHGALEQLLHGEPHPGNVLNTKDGPLFVDFENSTRGPVEYDLGWVPAEVSSRYPGADGALVGLCRGLVLAIVVMHRFSEGDEHPSGRRSGVAFLDALRCGPPWPALDEVRW